MNWQIPVILQIIVAYGVLQFMIKKIAVSGSRTRKLLWQYSFSAAVVILAVFLFGIDLFQRTTLIVMVIGAFNAFACYAHWRAFDISMSRTSLFTQADDLTCLALGYLVLGEAKLLNGTLLLGLVFSFGAVLLFSLTHREKNEKEDIGSQKTSIWVWIIFYSVIWGAALFSMRYLSLQGMPLQNYLAAWYLGSFIGALIVFVLGGRKERGEPLTGKQMVQVASLAVVLWVSLGLEYWSKMLAPLTVVQPIYQVSEMVLPTFIGLWIFKERLGLNYKAWVAIGAGLLGGMIIALSY